MKIRSGFVTNSSTTSFLIICDGDFTQRDMAELMGVQEGSPFADLAEALYRGLRRGLSSARSAREIRENYDGDFEAYVTDQFSEEVLKKVREAEKTGRRVYSGSLSSDNEPAETFFCCDSFEWENDRLYVNALQCVW